MSLRSRRRARQFESTELDLTPYMNLLVVLAPFLLVTAVFTRLSVLEIYLPSTVETPPGLEVALPDPAEQLQLTISITESGLLIANGNNVISLIPPAPNGPNLEAASAVLQQVKARFPEVENAIILSKPATPYETLVQVMDATRVAFVEVEGGQNRISLFPNISLGEIQ